LNTNSRSTTTPGSYDCMHVKEKEKFQAKEGKGSGRQPLWSES